jgi:hypothetical protein
MKRLITSNVGGHLLSLDDFRHIQEGFTEGIDGIVKSLIPNGVTQCILSGCVITVNGSDYTVTGGYIYYNGEIFQAMAGIGTTAGNDLYWVIDTTYAPYNPVKYETGEEYNVHEIRKMRLQQGSGTVASSSLQRLTQLFTQALDFDYIRNQMAEVGEIRLFRGNMAAFFDNTGKGLVDTKYANWALCNGNNSTVNLKGRFVVGFDTGDTDYNVIGKSGGAKNVTLSIDQIPAHTHTENGEVTNTGSDFDLTGGNGSRFGGRNTGSAGGGQSHENRPPYYVLAYIEKIA